VIAARLIPEIWSALHWRDIVVCCGLLRVTTGKAFVAAPAEMVRAALSDPAAGLLALSTPSSALWPLTRH